MKFYTFMLIVLLIATTSCRSVSEYPKVISDMDDFLETYSSLETGLEVVGVFSGAYHLEGGYSQEYGKTLIFRSRDKQYAVGFYKPEDGKLILLGELISFGDQQPTMTVYNDRQAIKGAWEGKRRLAYVDSGQLVIEDD